MTPSLLLGLLIILIPAIPTFLNISTKLKVVSFVLFIFILVIYGFLDYKDRRENKLLMNKLSTYLEKPTVSKEELVEFSKNLRNNENDQSLKGRTKTLSNEILVFLGEREAIPSPRPETWNEDIDRITRFYEETRNQYALRFGAKAMALYTQLAQAGFEDKVLEYNCSDPVNPLMMREVAIRFGALAERMP